MKKAIGFSTVAILALLLNSASAIECPKFPEQAKKDWEVKVSAEVAKIGPLKGAELNTITKNVTQDLFAKLPDAGRVYLEQMMLAAYCSTLRDDKTLSETEKSKRLREYIGEVRRVITTRETAKTGSKEPLAKNALGPSSYGKGSITQTSNAPQSQNIVADTVNILGLPQAQMDEIIKRFNLLDEALKKGKTSSEDARKNIEIIDKELSKIQREKFDSLPEDAKKWVHEMRSLLETFRERDSLIQASLRKQIEYRENLSQQMVVRIRDLFLEILGIIDSRVLALQEEKDFGIKYNRNQDFRLFVEGGSAAGPISLGHIRFKNGSSVDITLLPGTLVQGIAQYPPELQFFQVIDDRRSHSFSFKDKSGFGTITFGPAPLVPALAPTRAFNDVAFDPQQKVLGETLKKEFLTTFTQFIGSVISKDAVVKPDPR